MPIQMTWRRCLLNAAYAWWNDNAVRLSAALSFYATFSLAPMLILVVAASALLVEPGSSRDEVLRWVGSLIGEDGERIVMMISQSAKRELSGEIWAAAVPLLLGATAMFTELQGGLEAVWGGSSSTTVRKLLHQRLAALIMVFSLSGVLLASMVISALLAAAIKTPTGALFMPEPVVAGLSWALLLLVAALMFTVIYKVLPPAQIRWNNALAGGLITSGLFILGQFLVGAYLGTSGLSSLYGAAGSFVVVLLWLYYCSMIFFYGAEVTCLLEQWRPGIPPDGGGLNSVVTPTVRSNFG